MWSSKSDLGPPVWSLMERQIPETMRKKTEFDRDQTQVGQSWSVLPDAEQSDHLHCKDLDSHCSSAGNALEREMEKHVSKSGRMGYMDIKNLGCVH